MKGSFYIMEEEKKEVKVKSKTTKRVNKSKTVNDKIKKV